jgi:hypothetical protein
MGLATPGWSLFAIACCSFSFGLYDGTFDTQDVFFSCVASSPLPCGTDYEEHFSQPIATLANGFLTFIPGT